MQRRAGTQLVGAARVVDALVAPTGLAGVVAGALLLRDGQLAFAVIAWVATFVAGAALRLAAAIARSLAELSGRVDHLQTQIDAVIRDDSASRWRDWR